MPGGWKRYLIKRKDGQPAQPISALKVKEVYKNIYNDWPSAVVSRHRAVFAELDMLGPIAGRLCKDGFYKVCIFGHSHKSEMDRDTLFAKDRIYANSGYWCGENCTFVEVEENAGDYKVDLVKWKGRNELQRFRSE